MLQILPGGEAPRYFSVPGSDSGFAGRCCQLSGPGPVYLGKPSPGCSFQAAHPGSPGEWWARFPGKAEPQAHLRRWERRPVSLCHPPLQSGERPLFATQATREPADTLWLCALHQVENKWQAASINIKNRQNKTKQNPPGGPNPNPQNLQRGYVPMAKGTLQV